MKNTEGYHKLQILFPDKVVKELEKISEDMGIKRTDVVKIAVKKYVDEYKSK